MSDVEKITFDNHCRRQRHETAVAWERRAMKSARERAKQQNIRSWMIFLTNVSYAAFGAAVSMSAVFAAMGDFGSLATSASAAFISICGGLIFSEKIER